MNENSIDKDFVNGWMNGDDVGWMEGSCFFRNTKLT